MEQKGLFMANPCEFISKCWKESFKMNQGPPAPSDLIEFTKAHQGPDKHPID